jgi:Tol biopolymer transport system component
MNGPKGISVLASMGAWLLITAALWAQSPTKLFQEGLFKMETEGDLKEAIKIFERIISEYGTTNKAVAAKAQLYVGICQEKMGTQEARKTYQKVIDIYGDQPDAVRTARERLTKLAKTPKTVSPEPTGTVLTQVLSSTNFSEGSLSPDGTKLVYTNRGPASTLVLKDLALGTERTLIQLNDAFITAPIWSPDGKKVACSSLLPPHAYKLIIIGVEGGEIQQREMNASLCDWSADGKTFLCAMRNQETATVDFMLVPISGGKGKLITSIDYRRLETDSGKEHLRFYHGLPKLSPDGKFFTTALRKEEHFNLYLFSVADGREIQITDEPSDHSHPLWSPNGKSILFRSNRTSNWDLWSIPMGAGSAAGAPVIIRTNLGNNNYPICWTRSGKLLISTKPAVYNYLYAIPINSGTGEADGKASLVMKTALTSGRSPVWALSADGKRLAYVLAHEDVHRIIVTALETNQETEVARIPFAIDALVWSPEGERLAFHTERGRREKMGIYTVALQSKEPKMLLKNPAGRFSGIDWSPDGRKIAFIKGSSDIYTVEVESGDVQRIVYNENSIIRSVKWSPDGGRIAFTHYQKGIKESRLMTVQIDGGEIKQIVSHTESHFISSHSWSPDGRFITYSLYNPIKGTSSIWVVSAMGGAPKKLTTGFENSSTPKWWTDGTKIAFTATSPVTQGRQQYWVMENFQPQEGSHNN